MLGSTSKNKATLPPMANLLMGRNTLGALHQSYFPPQAGPMGPMQPNPTPQIPQPTHQTQPPPPQPTQYPTGYQDLLMNEDGVSRAAFIGGDGQLWFHQVLPNGVDQSVRADRANWQPHWKVGGVPLPAGFTGAPPPAQNQQAPPSTQAPAGGGYQMPQGNPWSSLFQSPLFNGSYGSLIGPPDVGWGNYY